MTDTARESNRTPVLGCIADDVTGATDLAINLVQGGMCAVQLLHVPTVEELSQISADAIVVALKTRSIAKEDAVSQSLAALRAMQTFGINRFFFKYCSTFDSTIRGNIGPVAVALLDQLDSRQTVFCPAFPRNGRTVYQGHLFVYGKLLNESGMEHHPLNPMTDANLVRFLGAQADRAVGLLAYDDIATGRAKERLDEMCESGCRLVVTDVCDEEHLKTIANAVVDMPLVTGGSGIARHLPDAYRGCGLFNYQHYSPTMPSVKGRNLIVSGSCSTATNQQVAWMKSKCPSWEIDVDAILVDSQSVLNELLQWANTLDSNQPALIYSTAQPDRVAAVQRMHGDRHAAEAIESFVAEVAAAFVQNQGVTRLVLAGGETSGAIVKKLGVSALRIGPEICAGVPWTVSLGERPLALALKSGNFGSEDFFERALEMLP